MSGLASYLVFFSIVATFYALLCLPLNLHWGMTGLMNVGITGFFGIGGYTAALLTGPDYAGSVGGFGLPVGIGYLGGAAAAALVALIVGGPALRLREDFLAIATFGFSTVVYLVGLNFSALTRGPDGLYGLPKPFAGYGLSNIQENVATLAFLLIVLALVYAGLEAMARSPWGRVLRALRENEEAAEALGKNVFSYRLQSFVLGSALMGLCGALYASFFSYFSPQDFLPMMIFQVYAMVIVGGGGNNRGAIAGAFIVWAFWSGSGAIIAATLPATLHTQSGAIRVVLIGLLLALMLLFRPQGVFPEQRMVSRDARLPDTP
jgi:branched-chain amino acid transport system permease protein